MKCYECGAEMFQKGESQFWFCPNCFLDTEKNFDAAVMRGFEIGYDVIAYMEKFKK